MAEYIDRNLIEWYGCDFENADCENRECSSCSHAECSHSQVMQIPLANVIQIPEGATNGDIIKAMFPNAIIEINELGSMVHVKYNNHTCWVNYELEWWNAPYKKEVEE